MTETNTSRENSNEQTFLIAYCLDNNVSFIPPSGLWGVDAWAKFLKVKPNTVRDWVKNYGIKHIGTKDNPFIAAEHFVAAIPVDCLTKGKAENDAAESE